MRTRSESAACGRRFFLVALLLAASTANAHFASDGFLRLQVDGARVHGNWEVALLDLHAQVPLDLDGDQEIRWGEIKARRAEIEALGRSGLSLVGDGEDCPLTFGDPALTVHNDRNYLRLPVSALCPAPVLALRVGYTLLFETDPQHRGLLRLRFNGEKSMVFTPDRRQQNFGFDQPPPSLFQYLREGALHVWSGLDHVLFLLTLALPAVVRRERGGWATAVGARPAMIETALVVTAFTVAHALTLTLVLLDHLSLPSRWVESAVALTVILAALNNLWPLVRRGLWALGFVFGLIHGAAIASVLSALELGTGSMVRALLGFNLGVEAGQLAIVAAVLPLTFLLRHSVIYRRVVVLGGSGVIALIGVIWLIERVFTLELLGWL